MSAGSIVLLWEPERYIYLIYLFAFVVTFLMLSLGYLYIAKRRAREQEAENLAFSRETLIAQEQERERISRELHDTVIQDLRCVSLGIERICRTDDEKEREKLREETTCLQSGLIKRLRDMCYYLVPPDFRLQGIGDALRQLCDDFGEKTGLDCRAAVTKAPVLEAMDMEKQLQIFRIVQESLNNVEKHAQAKEVVVILQNTGGEIHVGISDDGKGFSPSQNLPPLHIGIRGMKSRAAMLGGTLEISSEPGEGTMVQLRLPGENNVKSIAD
jgi:signal transduction histidine kinase